MPPLEKRVEARVLQHLCDKYKIVNGRRTKKNFKGWEGREGKGK